MRIYEEYLDAKEKREAQYRARRGRPTGRARGFVFIFNVDGFLDHRGILCYEAVSPLFVLDQGADPPTCLTGGYFMVSGSVSADYLRTHCRRVGKEHLPAKWAAFLEVVMQAV